jgi:hypothetical protein
MTEPELAPLDPELRALIDHERTRPGIPDAALARMRDRLGAAIPGVPAFATPTPPRRWRARGWLRALPVAAVGLALGGVVGALVHARLAPPPPAPPPPLPYYPEPLIINMPIPLPVPIFLLVTTPAPVLPTPRPIAPIVPRAPSTPTATPTPPAAPGPGHDTNLAAERALLDTARTALARRDLGAGLDALARHGDLYADGQLAEERDSLWIQALIAADKPDAARARAAKFREQFPHSLLLPVVEAALRTIP